MRPLRVGVGLDLLGLLGGADADLLAVVHGARDLERRHLLVERRAPVEIRDPLREVAARLVPRDPLVELRDVVVRAADRRAHGAGDLRQVDGAELVRVGVGHVAGDRRRALALELDRVDVLARLRGAVVEHVLARQAGVLVLGVHVLRDAIRDGEGGSEDVCLGLRPLAGRALGGRLRRPRERDDGARDLRGRAVERLLALREEHRGERDEQRDEHDDPLAPPQHADVVAERYGFRLAVLQGRSFRALVWRGTPRTDEGAGGRSPPGAATCHREQHAVRPKMRALTANGTPVMGGVKAPTR
jgi:hypothetical protein